VLKLKVEKSHLNQVREKGNLQLCLFSRGSIIGFKKEVTGIQTKKKNSAGEKVAKRRKKLDFSDQHRGHWFKVNKGGGFASRGLAGN